MDRPGENSGKEASTERRGLDTPGGTQVVVVSPQASGRPPASSLQRSGRPTEIRIQAGQRNLNTEKWDIYSHISLAVLISRCHLEPLQLGEELVTSSDQAVPSLPREPTPRLQTENEGALRTLLRRETGLRLAGPHSPAPDLREDRPESALYLPVFHQNQGGCLSWELSCPATINQWPPGLCGVPTRDTQQARSRAPISGTGSEETPPFPTWALNEAFQAALWKTRI